jgi:hypothetical protein
LPNPLNGCDSFNPYWSDPSESIINLKNAKNFSKRKVSSKMYPYTQTTVLNLVSIIDSAAHSYYFGFSH